MNSRISPQAEADIRDGMRIYWDAAIPMDDGVVLRADVFLPLQVGAYPVLMSYGPYAKGLAFQEGFTQAWELMAKENPDVLIGSSNRYQNWEVVDPEKWVPDGYAIVRVDLRGTGRSPGVLDMWSPRETEDLYDCIEWAATQPWCTGKVGLWHFLLCDEPVVGCEPQAAALDRNVRLGGCGRLLSRRRAARRDPLRFLSYLARVAVNTVQHGVGRRGRRSRVTGELVAGPETLSDDERARNRVDVDKWARMHNLDDATYRARSAKWDEVDVPFLSAANWGGQGLHPRGNYEAFIRAASRQKWLEVHGGSLGPSSIPTTGSICRSASLVTS